MELLTKVAGLAGAVVTVVLCLLTVSQVVAGLPLGEVHGFVDVRTGLRVGSDPNQDNESLGEVRGQAEYQYMGEWSTVDLRLDLVYDHLDQGSDVDLDSGDGCVDLRELSVIGSPLSIVDLKIGRQILTWGVGDMLFINDLFPKDWQSLFSGRDEEYLKAPSDAAMLSIFPGFANIDIVYTPSFDADRGITGERMSYWNSALGRRAGQDAVADPLVPDDWFDDFELAVRVSRSLGGYELALYAYDGFWKSPAGMDAGTQRPVHPGLRVLGGSLRGSAVGGVASVEAGYYDSVDDENGDNALLSNSETRFLVGYERELMRNVSGAVQYYQEYMSYYGRYLAGLQDRDTARDEDRHVITVRLTGRALDQNLVLSMFAYWSPSDRDAYLRPSVTYSVSDDWNVYCGANVFVGDRAHTFFGQFEDNSNVYVAGRYSF